MGEGAKGTTSLRGRSFRGTRSTHGKEEVLVASKHGVSHSQHSSCIRCQEIQVERLFTDEPRSLGSGTKFTTRLREMRSQRSRFSSSSSSKKSCSSIAGCLEWRSMHVTSIHDEQNAKLSGFSAPTSSTLCPWSARGEREIVTEQRTSTSPSQAASDTPTRSKTQPVSSRFPRRDRSPAQ